MSNGGVFNNMSPSFMGYRMPLDLNDSIEDLLIEAARMGQKSGDSCVELYLQRGNSLVTISVEIKELTRDIMKEERIEYRH